MGLDDADSDAMARRLLSEGYFQLAPFPADVDNDRVRDVAVYLRESGLRLTILDRVLLRRETVLIDAINWLYKVSQTNDGMCRLICNSLTVPILVRIVQRDPLLSKPVTAALHNLFLTLMADQTFKMSLALAYSRCYRQFSLLYGKCIGTQENSIYSLSVQFLNRESFVAEIAEHHQFLESVCQAIEHMLTEACHESLSDDAREGFSQHFDSNLINHKVLSYRRYNPLIGDLKVSRATAQLVVPAICYCISTV
jgi:hypothetical protein